MKQVEAAVVINAEVMAGVHLLQIHAPEVAAIAEVGQFVHVRSHQFFDPLLRRPLSLHRIGRLAPGWGRPVDIGLLFQLVGRGTHQIASLRPGDRLDLMGPLGQGFTLEPGTRRLLLVAGGLGIAPLVAAADAAIQRDVSVTLLAGARTASGLLPAHLLPAEVEYVVTTEDGSLGRRGMVTDLLPEYLPWPDQVFVCGPRPMLQSLVPLARDRRGCFQVSLEERMACGVGACLGCVVETRRGLQRVCREGPVFNLEELRL